MLSVYGCKLPFNETTTYASLNDAFIMKTGDVSIIGYKTEKILVFGKGPLLDIVNLTHEEIENVEVFMSMHFCTMIEVRFISCMRAKYALTLHFHRLRSNCARASFRQRSLIT